MRVLIVAANTERINLPTFPLGAALIAAATEARGHEVAFLDLMGEVEPERALRRELDRLRRGEDLQGMIVGSPARSCHDEAGGQAGSAPASLCAARSASDLRREWLAG
jgi:hypothetical protein